MRGLALLVFVVNANSGSGTRRRRYLPVVR
jgi:hypothetical protein